MRVKERTAELASANEHLQREITERKRAEEELKQMADELARSNADLKQFAFVASHDLQEPLHVISGYLKLLTRRYKGKLDAKADDFIDSAVDGVKRMQVLIKNLLEYSQVGIKNKDFKPTDCSLVVGLAVANLQRTIEKSGAVVTHSSLPTIIADFSQMSRLFQNLIVNSIKFRSKETPKVHVSAELKRMFPLKKKHSNISNYLKSFYFTA
jgi:light-regulated signal transduction histidine kinase (bacteriophytochrome)